MRRDGRLLATYGKGRARLKGYITDYAFLIEGLLGLYEWSADVNWLNEAEALTETTIEYYWDEPTGGFFFTASDHEELIVRSKTAQDGAIPSGNSVMLMNLQRLSVLLDRKDLRDKAGLIIAIFGGECSRTPFQHERLLSGIEAWHEGFSEIAIVGRQDRPETKELLRTIYSLYLPNKIVARREPDDTAPAQRIRLLADRPLIDGKPTAHVCRNFVCRRPTTEPSELIAQLQAAAPTAD
jgi:uncharacterized protein YyaL (SSP411 family)